MSDVRIVKVGEVFVPGGLPTITYNPRKRLGLEERLRDYLDERHKILSLSGPTKCGKTVLLRSIISDGIWLSGGSIASLDDVWNTIVDRLDLFTTHEEGEERQDVTGQESTAGGGAAPLGIGARVERASHREASTGSKTSRSRDRPIRLVAQEALESNLYPLVFDDFHYINPTVQLQIVRALKELVFNGAAVIFASVPHRAYDAVRVEKEMTGRVEQLQIPFWTDDELEGIATEGFAALNAKDESEVGPRLARESFSSPHLMQDFCLQLCKEAQLRETAQDPYRLEHLDWEPFFTARASAASKAAFDLLARGPRQRKDRKERTLVGGRLTDIYGAVLAAIADTGPLTKLTYEELRASLRKVLRSDPPQRHEVTRGSSRRCRRSRVTRSKGSQSSTTTRSCQRSSSPTHSSHTF